MADRSNIAWTNATWNPVRGCERVSEGCRNCYAEVLAARHSYEGGWGHEIAKWVKRPDGSMEARWTGVIEIPNHALNLPLKWKEPRRVFVNSMSDLFHDRVPFSVVDNVFDVMARCPQHTFQILTKRPARMLRYAQSRQGRGAAVLENAWLGVSVEHQAAADERIPLLHRTPAAVRWVSAEPLLGPVDLTDIRTWDDPEDGERGYLHELADLDWIVIGAESGSDYREMDMAHARSLIEQCKADGVAVFVKQDNGPRPGMKGRFTNEEWALKGYPA